ncbi:L-threonylcarbamoyladenylate synthase [Pontibacter silvestris]|uniref:L-threonylcarbamoyladenylate synthase n=1 Tax=Pontibacter silvestris TaxID=2305183 RepID=A0ABW4WRZ3_9BACT|nr:L-threonylcarbamoyladenylate synthase [Pontibacter silvestris]MCC9136279.1 threonylcarbamoyl-AMP synthase [Pontibacter silvestris]
MNELLKDVQAAEEEILLGNVILYPTDTVWGIGCDAESADAVKKIFKIKNRDEAKAMIVLVADLEMLQQYVKEIPGDFEAMLQKQDRPTTYVFPGARNLPKELISSDGSVGIRIVNDEFCHRLIRQIGRPLVSTSANESGQPAPKSFSEISEVIKERVDYVVRWRQEEEMNTQPSRVVKIETNGETTVLRE